MKRVALLLFLVAVTSACQVRADVEIDMKDNGSGTVTVRLGLDADAVKTVPNIADALRTGDLAMHGWTVTGPVKETDGFTTFAVSKPFANPTEANEIFKEIAGDPGPFKDFKVTRSRSFAHTDFAFTGKVQFGDQGVKSFGDSELAQQLDGEPLGEDVKALEQRIGAVQDKAFQISITVRFPGSVDSNAPGQFANGARWQPKLSEPGPVTLTATSRSTRWFTIIGTALAAVCALALIVCGVLFGATRRKTLAERRRRGTVTPPA